MAYISIDEFQKIWYHDGTASLSKQLTYKAKQINDIHNKFKEDKLTKYQPSYFSSMQGEGDDVGSDCYIFCLG